MRDASLGAGARAVPFVGSKRRTYPLLAAAGDIADDDRDAEKTATLLDRLLPDVVLTLGDMAYEEGTRDDYRAYYEPTWGRYKAITRPTPGNHEYLTPGAAGYFEYFGAAAGNPTKGYYSFDVGRWHIVALNSTCSAVGGCERGSPQERWLRRDLKLHPA
ncbi:MAG: metallophosphoesterase, partial [Thermoleophilia bacterium]|nr:metallophosphoesterase [Thermoleophilia bacterium]